MKHVVEFELQSEDVAAFRRCIATKAGGGRRQSWVIMLWFGILLSLAIFSAAVKGNLIGLLQIVAPIAIVVALVAFFVWRALRIDSAEETKKLIARHRVEVSPDGVAQSGEYGSSAFPWRVVVDIRDTDTHLFIFNAKNAAVVIPARSFATSGAFREFVDRAREFRRVASPVVD